MDSILADYLDVMFLENRSAAEGEKTVAAVEFNDVSLKGQLVRCKRALRGWCKERPPHSRVPLPRLLACGMAMILISKGQRLMGLKLLADHDTYLRPGESIDLRKKDIIPPVKISGQQYQWFSVIIRDMEDLKLETGQDWNLRQHRSLQQQGPRVSGRPVVSPCKVVSQHERSVVPFHHAAPTIPKKKFRRPGSCWEQRAYTLINPGMGVRQKT